MHHPPHPHSLPVQHKKRGVESHAAARNVTLEDSVRGRTVMTQQQETDRPGYTPLLSVFVTKYGHIGFVPVHNSVLKYGHSVKKPFYYNFLFFRGFTLYFHLSINLKSYRYVLVHLIDEKNGRPLRLLFVELRLLD